jgi:hypothetical protein
LKIGGTDSESCTTYESACGTLEYIMKTIINNSKVDHAVNIDTDTHNYPIFGDPSNYYDNAIFTLR